MRVAAILAGGKGSRLSKVSGPLPKPMVPLNGRPLLEYTVETLVEQGISDLVFFTGFESAQIEKHFGDGAKFGAKIRYVVENAPLGSAGSLLQNLDILGPEFFVVYGDTVFNVNFSRLAKFHRGKKAGLSLFLHPNDHPYDSDLVEIDNGNRITAFHKTPHDSSRYYRNLVNAALYAVNRDALKEHGFVGACDFARDIFPKLLAKGVPLFGYVSREYIKDMGTPDRFERVENDLKKGKIARGIWNKPAPAVFLDRDGTITTETDYVRSPSALNLFEGAGRALGKINASNHLAILVTNQPVLARGEVTEAQLQTIHNKLETELGRERAYLDAIYFCPHHPDRGFAGERTELKVECVCRKPGTGMIEDAAREHNIDREASWLIGDTSTDMLTASSAGIRSILVRTGYGGRDRKFKTRPDFEVAGLGEAVDFAIDDFDRIQRLLGLVIKEAKGNNPFVLAGPARSGKSLVASTLRWVLNSGGRRAQVVSLDHWLRPEDKRGATVDQRYDLEAFSAFMTELRRGPSWSGWLPYYDRHTRSIDPHGYPFEYAETDLIVFEGTIALHVPDLLKLDSVRVYVEAPMNLRKNRFEKEYALRGWTPEKIEEVFASREREEIPFIENSRHEADFILNLSERSAVKTGRK
ncbi:MAG: HAD-IIIA family hydrolase [Bdellovibrionia bacterium]